MLVLQDALAARPKSQALGKWFGSGTSHGPPLGGYTREPKKKAPKAPKPSVRDAVWSAWKDLPNEAQAVLTKAGVKPPPEKEEPESQDALLDLLKVHQDSLPAEVKAYVDSVDKAAMPSDDEAARSTTDKLKIASGKLRDLGYQKLRLQGRINTAKGVLTELYSDMKVLLADLVQTQKRVDELSKNFKDAMLAPPTEPAVPELDLTEVLKDLGIALTEDQSTRLVERVSDWKPVLASAGAKPTHCPHALVRPLGPPPLPTLLALSKRFCTLFHSLPTVVPSAGFLTLTIHSRGGSLGTTIAVFVPRLFCPLIAPNPSVQRANPRAPCRGPNFFHLPLMRMSRKPHCCNRRFGGLLTHPTLILKPTPSTLLTRFTECIRSHRQNGSWRRQALPLRRGMTHASTLSWPNGSAMTCRTSM